MKLTNQDVTNINSISWALVRNPTDAQHLIDIARAITRLELKPYLDRIHHVFLERAPIADQKTIEYVVLDLIDSGDDIDVRWGSSLKWALDNWKVIKKRDEANAELQLKVANKKIKQLEAKIRKLEKSDEA
jgi:hypothetical protein